MIARGEDCIGVVRQAVATKITTSFSAEILGRLRVGTGRGQPGLAPGKINGLGLCSGEIS